jgi:Ca2+-binding RTX toxin-like protein
MFESLEGRQLYSVTLVGNQLQITGDTGPTPNDVIKVAQFDANNLSVEVNGFVQFVADSAVNSIVINGGAGDDQLVVLSTPALPLDEAATINGGVGNDTIISGSGSDVLNGEAGDDVLRGGPGADVLSGGAGRNQMFGENGNDTMTGGFDADVFDGGFGTDSVSYAGRAANLDITLDGRANDGETKFVSQPAPFPPLLQVSEGDDVRENVENVVGGAGNDTIMAGSTSLNNVFDGGAGDDRLEGRGGIDTLVGGLGNDALLGGASGDLLKGGDGNDRMLGGAGDDDLRGGNGDDCLVGGVGADAMRGEAGNDVIIASDNFSDTLIDGGTGFNIADVDELLDLSVLSINIFA